MAPRSSWKGFLKLSLVSCPVQLFPATSSRDRVAFHLLNRETGHRLKRKLVDGDTGEEVETEDQIKGYQVGKNEYVLLEEDEITDVAIESSHTIEIETFVPRSEVDANYLETPYYLAPDGRMGEEAFAVIREAMRDKKVVGIGRIVLARRERPIMLEPRDKGLVATTLRYAYEVRPDADYFKDLDDVDVEGEMLDLATHIIGRKLGNFDPKHFEDRYQDALLDLIQAKQQHRAPTKAAPPPKGNVVSLMDALRKSIADEKTGGGREPAAKGDKESASKKASSASPTKATKSHGKPAAKPPAKARSTARRSTGKATVRLRKAS